MSRRGWIALMLFLGILCAAVIAWRTSDLQPATESAGPTVSESEQASAPVAPTPDVQDLEAAWLHPLFSPERAPDAQRTPGTTGPGLDGFRLTGVVIEGERKIAMFKRPDGSTLTIKEGATLTSAWQVKHINARRVELSSGDQSHMLELTVPRLPAVPVPPTTRSGRP